MPTNRLVTYLASNELFRNLDEAALSALEQELELVQLAEGETLYRQGDPGDSVYVLVRGRLGVRSRDANGREMVIGEEAEPGTSVGEMSLVTGQARMVTVFALSEAELVRLSKGGFDRLTEEHPHILADLAETTAPRWQRVQLARVLTNLLGELDTAALLDLQAELEWQQLSHGEVLFHRGDPGDATYIVVNGRLRIVVTRPDGTERVVDESGPGDIVGEFALLTGEPRSATVVAIRETNLVKLTPPVFARLLERYPHAMMHIARIIINRHKRSLRPTPAPRTRATNLALLPASQGVPLSEFAHRLAEHLAVFGPVMHLSSTRLDQVYGKGDAAQTTLDDPTTPILDGWMSEQETKHRFILYEADPTWSPWTARCVRQADRILIVGQPDADPTRGPVEIAMRSLGATARTELVLLHPADTIRPTGTSNWLAQRQVHTHHHVRINDTAHYQRLARRLTGRTVGLVLSGGAARGFAHLGVFRALEELGIPIDRVGGTSMGALLGAGYAMGRGYEDMFKLAEIFANPRQLFDYTLPFASLMATKKITRVVVEVCEGLHIEDLWRPYFCVSTNLSKAEPVIHQTGPLWKSVRASIAIPGIFSPILYESDVLVDGGAMNNFPVDIMRELSEGGTVIGVNVSPPEETAEAYHFGPSISGWQVLWSRINPFVKRIHVPSLAANLIRAVRINSTYQIKTEQSLADVLIQPDVAQFASLEFAAYESISEIGYQAARPQLALWRDEQEPPAVPTLRPEETVA
jgi:predicted acylesterase/phospholipase RssA/CRP-like cAMP-binding protein